MSTRDIDDLIARYLDGAMSVDEEEEFFVRMALDNQLREHYQAQRVVESALHKQRQSAPRPSMQSRTRFAAAVAESGGVADSSIDAGTARLARAPQRHWLRAIIAGTTIFIAVISITRLLDDDVASQHRTPIDSVVDTVPAAAGVSDDSLDLTSDDIPVVTGVDALSHSQPERDRAPLPYQSASRTPAHNGAVTNDSLNVRESTRQSPPARVDGVTDPSTAVKSEARPHSDSTSRATSDRASVDTINVKVRVTLPSK